MQINATKKNSRRFWTSYGNWDELNAFFDPVD